MRGLDRWIDAGFGGQDRINMEQDISRKPRSMKRVNVDAQAALARIQAIARQAGLVITEDWRTSDSPEAAAERARFEKEQGQ